MIKEIPFSFEGLTVYQRSVALSTFIFELTSKWPREHLFGITDQLRRASLSIPLNIAEGTSRPTKDFQRFILIARGSCYECIPLFAISLNLHILDDKNHNYLYNEIKEISRMLSKMHSSLNDKNNN